MYHLQIDHPLILSCRYVDAVQDLYSTDPTQETYGTAVDHADDTVPNRQHELDHTHHIIQFRELSIYYGGP